MLELQACEESAEATSYYLNPNIVASWTGGLLDKCYKIVVVLWNCPLFVKILVVGPDLCSNCLRHGGTLQ